MHIWGILGIVIHSKHHFLFCFAVVFIWFLFLGLTVHRTRAMERIVQKDKRREGEKKQACRILKVKLPYPPKGSKWTHFLCACPKWVLLLPPALCPFL